MGCGSSTDGAWKTGARSKYTEVGLLGEGASCKVVEVQLKGTGESRAMKILTKAQLFADMLYRKEVELLLAMKHPNILRVIEQFEDSKHFYLVTGCCRGGELFDRIVDDAYQYSEQDVSRLARTMLDCLKYCHDMNIVHRDLKPENYIFETPAKDSKMIMIDFGCGLRVSDDATYTDVVGTPFYMAPETIRPGQIRTGRTLKSADLWAVGVIVFVMMTGRPPFDGTSNKEIFRCIARSKLRWREKDNAGPELKRLLGKKILLKSWTKRITVDAALKDPWVCNKCCKTTRICADVCTSLRQFQYQNKLKKALARSLAASMGHETSQKIKKAFKTILLQDVPTATVDTCGKKISMDELTQLLNQHLDFTYSDAQKEAQAMLDAHANGDDGISFSEFAEIWQQSRLVSNKEYMRDVFDAMDTNKDGLLCAEDLQAGLQEKEMDQIIAMIKEVDNDGDGKISFEEFEMAMSQDIMKKKLGNIKSNACGNAQVHILKDVPTWSCTANEDFKGAMRSQTYVASLDGMLDDGDEEGDVMTTSFRE